MNMIGEAAKSIPSSDGDKKSKQANMTHRDNAVKAGDAPGPPRWGEYVSGTKRRLEEKQKEGCYQATETDMNETEAHSRILRAANHPAGL